MRYWWVNQNQTFKHEVEGGFLWSPKSNKNGSRNQFYENMKEISPGDLIFSFCDTKIRAFGIATAPAVSKQKPNFGAAGNQWANDGWLVEVAFRSLQSEIHPRDFIGELAPHLSGKYDPIRVNGGGNQVYLAEISEGFANVLLAKADLDPELVIKPEIDHAKAEAEANAVEADIAGRTDIGATEKERLIRARRGQGVFKSNVQLKETCCRVTGTSDIRFLIASHIKPWAKSSDEEKLDGRNGLLLAPHIDRLFDRGFISFDNAGNLLVSEACPSEILGAWGIDTAIEPKPLSAKQREYLAFHREMFGFE